MSSPSTKRDQRRETRRQQLLQQQEERRRARERARRQQQLRTIGITIGVIVIIGLLVWGLVAHFAVGTAGGGGGPRHAADGTRTAPASGQTIDGITCSGNEMLQVHYHSMVEIYVDGQPQQVPAGIGIVEPDGQNAGPHLASNGSQACLYWLHTHQATGMVHIEAPNNDTYTLGNLFDIWGQPISGNTFMNLPVDSSHKLVIDTFDASGKMTTYTGDPRNVPFADHETVVVLYNSPNVQAKAFTLPSGVTDWGNL